MKPFGIPTKYAGVQFRSRLEAKWAAFFDLCNWKWRYEPFDLDKYIPDFLIEGKEPLLVEVKPELHISEMEQHGRRVYQAGWPTHREVLVLGIGPMDSTYWCEGTTIGALCERWWDGAGKADITNMAWGEAVMNRCLKCNTVGFHHDVQLYTNRICGHHIEDGGDHGVRVIDMWNEASNAVQWRSPVRN